jgi:DNA-directed RNA polymerase sigma subunit (sigma70/sigma32)
MMSGRRRERLIGAAPSGKTAPATAQPECGRFSQDNTAGLPGVIDLAGCSDYPTDKDTVLLEAAEEVELAKRIEAGLYAQHLLDTDTGDHDPALLRLVAGEGQTALSRFVLSNRRLAAWWARRRAAVHQMGALTVDDLTNEGVLGVMHAVYKFDFMLGYKFSTYASWWIRHYQQLAVMAAAPVGLDHRDYRRAAQVVMIYPDLAARLRRTPTAAELAEELGTTVTDVAELTGMLRPALSLDTPLGSASTDTLADLLPAAGVNEDPVPDPQAAVEVLMETLSAREQSLLSEVFGLHSGRPKTVVEVARERQVPPAKVAALVDAALAKLRASATGRTAA